jgi:cyanophycinase
LVACVAQLRSFKGTLVAMGGGPDPEGQVLPEFIRLAGGPFARLVTVPVASYVREMSKIYFDILHEYGIQEVWHVDPEGEQCNWPIIRPSLLAASGIVITGGDQKRLAVQLVGTLVVEVVLEALRTGIPVYCTSASTVGLSDHMIGGLAEDDSVMMMPGLGILPGITIETHVTQRDRHGRLTELAARHVNPVLLGLDENTALFFIPGTSKAVVRGPGQVVVLCCRTPERSHVLHAGDVLDIADLLFEIEPLWGASTPWPFRGLSAAC